MAAESTQQQVTDLYNQLVSINSILSKLASLSAVSTIQTSLTTTMNNLYNSINVLQQNLDVMDTTVSGLLVQVRNL